MRNFSLQTNTGGARSKSIYTGPREEPKSVVARARSINREKSNKSAIINGVFV
jgi:hypothetical protein